jgi:tRNA modification GTPase
VRETDERIERMGVEVSRRWLAAADLVLLCVEAGRAPETEELELAGDFPAVLARTKADLGNSGGGGGVSVSTVTGQGLDIVRRAVAEAVFGRRVALGDLEIGLTRARHRNALEAAAEALTEARPHLEPGGDAVLAAHHVRMAALALDELVGAIDVEDVLERIFSSFCVGK